MAAAIQKKDCKVTAGIGLQTGKASAPAKNIFGKYINAIVLLHTLEVYKHSTTAHCSPK